VLRTLNRDRLREADLRGIGEWGMGVSGRSTSSIGSFVFTAIMSQSPSNHVGVPGIEHQAGSSFLTELQMGSVKIGTR
jgi:hypothetical protein